VCVCYCPTFPNQLKYSRQSYFIGQIHLTHHTHSVMLAVWKYCLSFTTPEGYRRGLKTITQCFKMRDLVNHNNHHLAFKPDYLTLHHLFLETAMAISVQCPTRRYIVILFQPVTLNCKYQTTATQLPVVMWKYKSYCRDPIQAAFNPSSAESILSQNNPNYDPNIECADSQRTVRIVASKQGDAVTLGGEYQGRKISILNSELIKVPFRCIVKT